MITHGDVGDDLPDRTPPIDRLTSTQPKQRCGISTGLAALTTASQPGTWPVPAAHVEQRIDLVTFCSVGSTDPERTQTASCAALNSLAVR